MEAFEEKQSFPYWVLVLAAATPASSQHLDSPNSTFSLKLLSRPLAAEPFGLLKHTDNMNGFHIDEAHNRAKLLAPLVPSQVLRKQNLCDRGLTNSKLP